MDLVTPLTAKDTTNLRGLLGSLQWPAVQSSPHLQASASLLAGQVSSGTVETLNEANRLLRFAKGNSDVSLEYKGHLSTSRSTVGVQF